jgi:hypothetical protein
MAKIIASGDVLMPESAILIFITKRMSIKRKGFAKDVLFYVEILSTYSSAAFDTNDTKTNSKWVGNAYYQGFLPTFQTWRGGWVGLNKTILNGSTNQKWVRLHEASTVLVHQRE